MNIRIILLLTILSVFINSCSLITYNEDKDAPAHLIAEEEMITILADMQITEAYLKTLKKPMHLLKDSSMLYYRTIFKKNNVTKEQFEESLLYYKKDLAELEKMYTKVIIRLNELKAKNDEILLEMKADTVRQDSIERAHFIMDSIRVQDSLIFLSDSIHIQDSLIHLSDSILISNDTTK